jgi:hypothetical protein
MPGTGYQVLIENQSIPSHHRRTLRTRRGHGQLMKYIQQKHQLSEVAVSRISWTSRAQAIRKLPDHQQHLMVKFLSKWLPVGKQINRYNPAAYPSQCPSCSCAIEDFDHAFPCPDPSRRRWRTDLRQALLRRTDRSNTDPALVDLVINGLHHWFQNTPSAPVPRFARYETLVEHQISIGWDQLIFGRWSTLRATHQSSYLQRQKILPTPTSHGTGWTSRIISLIWTHCHNVWLDRNQALHGHNQQTKHLARLHRVQFRIRALYDLRNQCSQCVCYCWIYPSIEDHFSRVPDPTQLEDWLALNEARILRHVASRLHTLHIGQQHITDYFTSIT